MKYVKVKCCFWGVILSSMPACEATEISGPVLPAGTTGQFTNFYEPSGALTLPNGNVLIIEDESRHPLNLWVRADTANGQERAHEFSIKTSGFKLGQLEDLEGIASNDQGHIYVVTSHARTLSGKQRNARKKLVRFELDGSNLGNSVVVKNLRKKIFKKYDAIKNAASSRKTDFNIEGLSFNRANQTLMIGLRTPLIDDEAVIIIMENPGDVFNTGVDPRFAKSPISLDLDKGGIRAIAFDPELNGYLILSRREDKKDKSFKLWHWDGNLQSKPERVRFEIKVDLSHAEGIARFRSGKKAGLIIVFDDGNRAKRAGGHYVHLPYDQLKIGENPKASLP